MTRNGVMPVPNVIKVCPAVLELKHADKWTDTVSPICIHVITLCTEHIVTTREDIVNLIICICSDYYVYKLNIFICLSHASSEPPC